MLIDAWDIQRAAAGDSELVAMVVNLWEAVQIVEVKVGVQVRVADVFVGKEMVVVRAGLGGNDDRIAGAEPVFG